MIIGIDEAGRGALAGPVVAGAVIKPVNEGGCCPVQIADSKLLSWKKREEAYDWILGYCVWGVGVVSASRIDAVGIKVANHEAMQMALGMCLEKLEKPLDTLKILVDGRDKYRFDYPSEDIVGGDGKIWEIGAASIVAKVSRDRIMEDLGERYPRFMFGNNKGYGAKEHYDLLDEGICCEVHRKTYDPLKTFLTQGRLF